MKDQKTKKNDQTTDQFSIFFTKIKYQVVQNCLYGPMQGMFVKVMGIVPLRIGE